MLVRRLLGKTRMKPAYFAVWLVASAFVLTGLAVATLPFLNAWLVGLLTWALLVVPLSFQRWFAAKRRQEQDDTARAIERWSRGASDAGALLAVAVDEALEEEDARSLERLLQALNGAQSEPLRTERDAFVAAARAWLADDGSRASRDAHLAAAREQARPLTARLRAR